MTCRRHYTSVAQHATVGFVTLASLVITGCSQTDDVQASANATAVAQMQQSQEQMRADMATLTAAVQQIQASVEQQATAQSPKMSEQAAPEQTPALAPVAVGSAPGDESKGGTAASPAPPGEALNFASGPLVDVYVLEDVPDYPIFSKNDDSELLEPVTKPDSESAGTMIGTEPLGDYKAFLEDQSLALFRRETIGLETHGFLNLTEAGRHGFAIELSTKAHVQPAKGRRHPSCTVQFSLGGKKRAEILVGSPQVRESFGFQKADAKPTKESPEGYLAWFDGWHQKFTNVFESQWFETVSIQIPEAGVYAASMWTACVGINPDFVTTTIRIRTPADRALRPITPSEFWHAE